MSARPPRILVAGWPSFIDGEATAGDVLAMEAVAAKLGAAGIQYEVAWSPVFQPWKRTLADADPARYSHLVFVCGPLSGRGIEELHRRFAACRRVAIGVSVIDPADPAAAGFHVILARDS
ncbi:MAG TPA: polysaccharide pyruvyl transferase family protein, partial [Streptosporangiaceae bacterium]